MALIEFIDFDNLDIVANKVVFSEHSSTHLASMTQADSPDTVHRIDIAANIASELHPRIPAHWR